MRVIQLPDISLGPPGDDGRRSITGIAALPNNRLIITEYFNTEVRLIDCHCNAVLSVIDVNNRPWSVCLISTHQAAVPLLTGKIQIVGISDVLCKERIIPVATEDIYDVAFSQDRLVIAFGARSPKVEVIDLQGNLLKRIKYGSDSRRLLFQSPRHICVSQDGETIYVSDEEIDRITSVTFEGIVKSSYQDEELVTPGQLCNIGNGNICVLGYRSQNIHMIIGDCNNGSVILTKANGLDERPTSIAYCPDTHRLFIWKVRTDALSVYQLIYT